MRLRRSLSEGISSSALSPSSGGARSCAPRRMHGPGRPWRLAARAPQGDGSWFAQAASRERLGVFVDHALELAGGGVGEVAGGADILENVVVLSAQQAQ